MDMVDRPPVFAMRVEASARRAVLSDRDERAESVARRMRDRSGWTDSRVGLGEVLSE
jgi:hypothetical protein